MLSLSCCTFGLSSPEAVVDDKSVVLRSPCKGKPPRQTVYEEAIAMMTGSLIIYVLADLRDMAREGEIDVPLGDLSPPLTASQVLAKIQGNEEALAKRAYDHEDLKKRLLALTSLQEHESSLFRQLYSTQTKESTVMTHFCDDQATEEIVHAIIVNEERHRITVVFRGSVTQKDFIQDAKCAQKKIENPVSSLVESEEFKTEDIRIHTGFWEYLLKVNPVTETSRYEDILKDVKSLLRKFTDYDLFCCGHSLGGALCTIFGFFAAADDELVSLLRGPVVVYSIASPYCGNWKFQFAFQHLERTKRLQHLRIANHEDMVTLLPFAAPKLTALSPALSMIKGAGNLYKHCGMRLQMIAEPRAESKEYFTISYPKDHQADDEEYAKEAKDALEAGKSLASAFYALITKDFDRIVLHHSCEEYERRLERCKRRLMSVTIDDLYSNKTIVGNFLDESFQPRKMDSGMDRAKRALGYLTSSSKSQPDGN